MWLGLITGVQGLMKVNGKLTRSYLAHFCSALVFLPHGSFSPAYSHFFLNKGRIKEGRINKWFTLPKINIDINMFGPFK